MWRLYNTHNHVTITTAVMVKVKGYSHTVDVRRTNSIAFSYPI